MTYYWTTTTHINGGDRRILVEQCPELGICRQTVSGRNYRILEEFCFFAGECGEDDPTYTLAEILAEAKYRQALREIDAIELSEEVTA